MPTSETLKNEDIMVLIALATSKKSLSHDAILIRLGSLKFYDRVSSLPKIYNKLLELNLISSKDPLFSITDRGLEILAKIEKVENILLLNDSLAEIIKNFDAFQTILEGIGEKPKSTFLNPILKAILAQDETIRRLAVLCQRLEQAKESLKDNRKIVMVVEEDAAIRKMMDDVLKRNGFFPVLSANKKEFLYNWGKYGNQCGILFLDVKMRGTTKDSKSIVDMIQEKRSSLPIIAHTGGGVIYKKIDSVATVLHKPANLKAILEVIANFAKF